MVDGTKPSTNSQIVLEATHEHGYLTANGLEAHSASAQSSFCCDAVVGHWISDEPLKPDGKRFAGARHICVRHWRVTCGLVFEFHWASGVLIRTLEQKTLGCEVGLFLYWAIRSQRYCCFAHRE